MSVIGRMDKQVEEILIAPIARRHEQQRLEREKAEERPEDNQTSEPKKDEKS